MQLPSETFFRTTNILWVIWCRHVTRLTLYISPAMFEIRWYYTMTILETFFQRDLTFKMLKSMVNVMFARSLYNTYVLWNFTGRMSRKSCAQRSILIWNANVLSFKSFRSTLKRRNRQHGFSVNGTFCYFPHLIYHFSFLSFNLRFWKISLNFFLATWFSQCSTFIRSTDVFPIGRKSCHYTISRF